MLRLQTNSLLVKKLVDHSKSAAALVHSSSKVEAGKLWRQNNNLPKLQTARGLLIDTPDYSFKDGRPIPLGNGQIRRKAIQQKLAKDIFDGLTLLNRLKSKLAEKEEYLNKIIGADDSVLNETEGSRHEHENKRRRTKRIEMKI